MFLNTIAKDLYEKTGGDLRNTTVVFPTKRAGLFFNQQLYAIAGKPVWAPSYATIDELFYQMTDAVVADQPLLIFHLFAAYQQAAQEVNGMFTGETIDDFYSWGEVMLSDFDDIDNNLADADKIFTNLKDLDDLTSTDYLSEEQIKAIERYFGYFEKDKDSKLKEKFLSVWHLLYPTYQAFKDRLRKDEIAYAGMLKRDVAEAGMPIERLPQGHYVFVGFNVLNATEKRLMDQLKEEGRAWFYWDYDIAYTKGEGKTFFEAGRFVKENKAHFGSELSDDDPVFSQMNEPKQITIVESPSNNGQTRFAGEVLRQQIEAADLPLNQQAVVLCNERLLQPMLHAMPADKDGKPLKLNVTMGFPLYETPAASFVMMMLELQVFGDRNGMWNYKQVATLLRHPFTVRIAGEVAAEKLRLIKERHLFFVPESTFLGNEFLSALFLHQRSVGSLLEYLSEMVQRVGMSFFNDPSEKNPDFDRQLYEESVYNVYALLNRLRMIYEQVMSAPSFKGVDGIEMSEQRIVKLVRQILQSASVPFHGEPAEGIQIIGMLETRSLDFTNLIMLGMEDENMPKSIRKSSFIPYTLREAYGMTTFDKQSSLHAYGFYRLMQRAKHITLIYCSAENGLSKGEMSRYLTQMLVEKETIFSPQTTLERKSLESRVMSYPQQTFEVAKTQEMIDLLKASLTQQRDGKPRFLSPSALNTYIDCPFRFYLQRIAKLKPDDELEEEVGNDVFGTIFHHCMEQLYRPLIGRKLLQSDLTRMANDKERIAALVDEGFRETFFKSKEGSPLQYNGEQWLNREVIMKYVRKQLTYDGLLCPLIINGVENDEHVKKVTVDGFEILLGGIIDRIDTIFAGTGQEQHRIVDYKTSSSPQSAQSLESLFDPALSKRPYHILQTFYYADIYTDYCRQPVGTSLMYVKPTKIDDAKEAEKNALVGIGASQKKQPVNDFSTMYKEEFHEKLMGVIREIFSTDVPFTQTNNDHSCQYCDFKELCNRGKGNVN